MIQKVGVRLLLAVVVCSLLLTTAEANVVQRELPICDTQINCRIVLFETFKNGSITDIPNNLCKCASDKQCKPVLEKDDKKIYYCR